MIRSHWTLLSLLVLAQGTIAAEEVSVEAYLPPSARHAEKRALGGEDENVRRAAYGYPGGIGAGAAFSPDGKLLVTAGGPRGTTLWEVATGRALGQLANLSHNEGLSAAFTPDSKQLVTASWGGHQNVHPVTLWDAQRRERIRSLDEDANDTPFSALALSPDARTLALGAGMGRRAPGPHIVFWYLTSGDEIGRLDRVVPAPSPRRFGVVPTNPILALAYSPDGRSLAVLLDGSVLLVELATGRRRAEMTFPSSPEGRIDRPGTPLIGALAFSPDGRLLAVGCPNGAIRRFDLRAGREITPLPGHKSPVLALCWGRDGRRLQSWSMDGQFLAWRGHLGREWHPKAGPLPEGVVELLWDVLREDEPVDLFGCQQTLIANPAQTVPFLHKRLAPVPKADVERIDRLVADLQKGDYNARKRALIQLRKLGREALPALRTSQERGGYDELIRRLLMEFENLAPPAEQVRALRALRVLERIGTPEARKLLETLAGGAPEAAVTTQAKAALDRLAKAEPVKAETTPEALWEALSGEDSAAAYRAIRALANRPATATLLRDRLKGIAATDTFNDEPKRVAKLIDDLGSDAFAVREQASKDLRNLGQSIIPALRKAIDGTDNLEAKRRLQRLLDAAGKAPSPELLRVGRALEALELMSAPEAQEALKTLEKDLRAGWLRNAVSAAIGRQGAARP
jgi:hypothetical protein